MLVLAVLCRNHPPCPDRVIEFAEGRFALRDDMAATKETTSSRAKKDAEIARLERNQTHFDFLVSQIKLRHGEAILGRFLAQYLSTNFSVSETYAANIVTAFSKQLPPGIRTWTGEKNARYFASEGEPDA
jgi:hypothetical protein